MQQQNSSVSVDPAREACLSDLLLAAYSLPERFALESLQECSAGQH